MVTAVASLDTGAMSPTSSPRLPSPPPFPEVQTGPDSASSGTIETFPARSQVSKRIRPGTKALDMARGPSLVPLSELNSPFQLQEYLKALHHKESHDEEGNTRAINRAAAARLATPPEGVERSLWLYELCRLLIARVNILIVGFFNDSPKCSSVNCPEMRASEWQYLCAVHDPPKSCCAIDYCCHTLDWATNIITSQKHFPSRLTLGGDGGASQQGIRQLTNIFRRVYRMFAHAWFQHRDVFWQVENTEGLYVFYKTVCEVYSLMPPDTYTVPPEAEGMGVPEEAKVGEDVIAQQDLPLRPKVTREGTVINIKDGNATSSNIGAPASAKRHKHTPSTGSSVPPITEDDEDTETVGDTDDQSDDASVLSTVRFDPKDLASSGSVGEEDSGTASDVASQIPSIVDGVHHDLDSTGSETQPSAEEDGKTPVTPIDDEPSSDQRSASAEILESTKIKEPSSKAASADETKDYESEEVKT